MTNDDDDDDYCSSGDDDNNVNNKNDNGNIVTAAIPTMRGEMSAMKVMSTMMTNDGYEHDDYDDIPSPTMNLITKNQ